MAVRTLSNNFHRSICCGEQMFSSYISALKILYVLDVEQFPDFSAPW